MNQWSKEYNAPQPPAPLPTSTKLYKSVNQLIFCSTAAASDISQEEDLEREVEDEMEKIPEDFESLEDEDRQRVSDIQLEEENRITENEEEEISAL